MDAASSSNDALSANNRINNSIHRSTINQLCAPHCYGENQFVFLSGEKRKPCRPWSVPYGHATGQSNRHVPSRWLDAQQQQLQTVSCAPSRTQRGCLCWHDGTRVSAQPDRDLWMIVNFMPPLVRTWLLDVPSLASFSLSHWYGLFSGARYCFVTWCKSFSLFRQQI